MFKSAQFRVRDLRSDQFADLVKLMRGSWNNVSEQLDLAEASLKIQNILAHIYPEIDVTYLLS